MTHVDVLQGALLKKHQHMTGMGGQMMLFLLPNQQHQNDGRKFTALIPHVKITHQHHTFSIHNLLSEGMPLFLCQLSESSDKHMRAHT